jgi:hypothetical protein
LLLRPWALTCPALLGDRYEGLKMLGFTIGCIKASYDPLFLNSAGL